MNRRRFLSTSALGGAVLAGLAGSARAFTVEKCEADSATPACRELVRHHELLAQLKAKLDDGHLSPAEREALLASATCPYCGGLLGG
jgi:hypothetical protein